MCVSEREQPANARDVPSWRAANVMPCGPPGRLQRNGAGEHESERTQCA